MKPDQPSRTALVVGGGVAFAASEPGLTALVDAECAELTRVMLRASSGGRRLLRWIDSPFRRRMLRTLERRTIPGIIRHWVCRKRWLASAWNSARADGFDTLALLGSGFDTLSIRAARSSAGSVRTIDVDHPATLGVRRMALEGMTVATHRFLAHDLNRSGLDTLLNPEIPVDASLFVLVEGVLMYLPPARVDALFDELCALRPRRLRIAFTFMETPGNAPPAFRPRSRLVDFWLWMRGEPFCSGLDPAHLADWLAVRGLRQISFSQTPGRPGDGPHGECAAVAERL